MAARIAQYFEEADEEAAEQDIAANTALLEAGATYGPTDPEGAGEPHETEGFDPQLGLAEPSLECRRIMNKWTSKCVFGPPES